VDLEAAKVGEQAVWHAIKFTNTSGRVLTTGPVIITNPQSAFISQDLMRYTGKGSECSIILTKAMEVKVSVELKENE